MQAAPFAFEDPAAESAGALRAVHWMCLATLLALGALFRVGLVERLAPQRPEPDAYYALQLDVMTGHVPGGATARGKAEQLYGAYPTFVVSPLAALLGERLYTPAPLDAPLPAHLAAAARPLVAVRTWCAALCVLGLLGVFFLAREFVAPRAALVACAFVTFSLLHLVYSHQARPHAPHMTFQVWALWAAVRYLRRPSTARLALAGLTLWAGFASLQTGAFLAPAIALAVAFSATTKARKIAAAATAVSAWLLSKPFHVGGVELSSDGISMASGGHAIELAELNGGGVWPTWRVLSEQEPSASSLALVGIVALFVAYRSGATAMRPWLVLAGYAAPYLAFALLNESTRDRYLIPLLPFFALLAAFALERFAAFIPTRGRLAWGLMASAALALPVHDATLYWRTAARDDTLTQAAGWIQAQPVETTSRIVTSPYIVLPLAATRSALESIPRRSADESAWNRYQLSLGAPPSAAPLFDVRPFTPRREGKDGAEEALLARLDELAPTLIVVELSNRQRALPWHARFEALVREHGERVASFAPETDEPPKSELLEYGDVVGLRSRLRAASRMGPPLEIYRWMRR